MSLTVLILLIVLQVPPSVPYCIDTADRYQFILGVGVHSIQFIAILGEKLLIIGIEVPFWSSKFPCLLLFCIAIHCTNNYFALIRHYSVYRLISDYGKFLVLTILCGKTLCRV